MNKKGKAKSAGLLWGVLVVILVLVALSTMAIFGAFSSDATKSLIGGGGDDDSSGSGVGTCNFCPDTGQTSVSLNVYNQKNETGSEAYNVSYRVYDSEKEFLTNGEDTTSASVNFDCGKKQKLRLLGADSTDNAKIMTAEGVNSDVSSDGKYVEFTPCGASGSLNIYSNEAGVLEVRAYDNNGAGWIYDNADNDATNYETDGATFMSTTNNATNMSVGTAGDVDIKLETRCSVTDEVFGDFGTYILVDAKTSVWNEPDVEWDGTDLDDMKGELNVNEARAWSGYEYVYFTDEVIDYDGINLGYKMTALSGIDPAGDDRYEIDFGSKSSYKQTSGSAVEYAGVDDSSSPSVIHAIQDYNFHVS